MVTEATDDYRKPLVTGRHWLDWGGVSSKKDQGELELLNPEIELRRRLLLASPGRLCSFALAPVCLSRFVLRPKLVSVSDENFLSLMKRFPLREMA